MPWTHLLADAIGPAFVRGPDGGPTYTETDLGRWIAEPWNAASCLLFLILAVVWAVRLRGQYRRHAFLAACLPLVVVGGVGGTVYHAFRAHRVWLFLDWVPIVVLGFAISVHLWSRIVKRWGYALLVIPAVFLLQTLNFRYGPRPMAINVSYSILGAVILVPAAAVLWKTRFRYGLLPLGALVCFAAAIGTRAADRWSPPLLPMGTHWLWHVFGAAAGFLIAEYLYRLPKPRRL